MLVTMADTLAAPRPFQRLQRLGAHLRPGHTQAAAARRGPTGALLDDAPEAAADASPLAALASQGKLRIGLIADTHVPEALPELWAQAYAAFVSTYVAVASRSAPPLV